ncbi:diguanylate cyclase [Sinimarinibacterium sp. NLF-5-8]|uniref:GGDEF domain-containing protein n=1 Tax=Sinimarinibacterium sp. NLF-5-8 TaxID=2698684 RepID=UPI00137C255E|nr:GGDEF domain-containing protein [Sinimarinibacterium sp. NLF-5-8]QHS10693.1 GGDEF domain-containing protein [Sinimarinibacterium sp. NLF-5-8]
MTTILKGLAEMTSHRDHLRLEVSVLSTLQSLRHVLQVRARSWTTPQGVINSPFEARDDANAFALNALPVLARGLQQRLGMTCKVTKGQHVLWLPVWLHNQMKCCIEITQSQPFSELQLDVINGIFQVYQNYQRLLDDSQHDALTALLNRKTFDEQFARRIHTQRQWLAVIDIDHFKAVNDDFGHLYGDEVLILVANRLRAMFRQQDRIFRFGGEEFVVLLNDCTQQQAHNTLERLHADIARHDFPQIGHITISIGFANAQGALQAQIEHSEAEFF